MIDRPLSFRELVNDTLTKDYPFSYAEIHVDAYNATNSVRWGNPNTTYSANPTGNTFGQIGGPTGGQRSLRFGARFVF